MAAHRAEQILDAVKSAVTNLATTGENVYKGRVYSIGESVLPALSVYAESETPIDEYAANLVDRELIVTIDGFAIPTDADQVDTRLNQIRKEVTIALNADRTLGLSFVIDTIEQEASYTLEGETSNPIGMVSTKWAVHYRRSMTDPSA